MYRDGKIEGLTLRPLKFYNDERGWLVELFREDEVEKPIMPAMSYISMTKPGMSRGPHEHVDQTDYFAFIGPGTYLFTVWDNRKESPTYNHRTSIIVGESNPTIAIIPPGVVHGYANIGANEGIVYNAPNRLYAGWEKKERVDEIRHEDDPRNPFVIDFLNQIEESRKP